MTRRVHVELTQAQAEWLEAQMQQIADLAPDGLTARRADAIIRAISHANQESPR